MTTIRRPGSFLALSATVLAAVAALAQPLAAQQRHTEHSFSDVERWRRIFESPQRDNWQKPEEVIRALQIKPGMVIADVGAGTGYFAARFAVAVGPEGKVYAADLEPNMVAELRDRARRAGLTNLIPVQAKAEDPQLPNGSSDMIFLCNTWHLIDGHVAYARALRNDLGADGKVVIVDFRVHNVEGVKAEFEQAGYRLVASHDILPRQYILVFEAGSD